LVRKSIVASAVLANHRQLLLTAKKESLPRRQQGSKPHQVNEHRFVLLRVLGAWWRNSFAVQSDGRISDAQRIQPSSFFGQLSNIFGSDVYSVIQPKRFLSALRAEEAND
jgi:hypothetical protein